MGKTIAGVYHNIQESEFVVTDGSIYLFFTSSPNMKKFLAGYEENRQKMNEKYEKIIKDEIEINQSVLFDLVFYKKCEKRDFYCILNGKEISEEEFKGYAIQKMELNEAPNYQGVFLLNGNKDLLGSESEVVGEVNEPQ